MDSKEIKREAKRIANSIKVKLPDAKVYVFGSVAAGSYIEGKSDIDMVVVSKFFSNKKFLERLHALNSFFDFPDVKIDIIPLTPKEFAELSKRKTSALYGMKKKAILL
ncbi:MAG: nucleotidyltransferase domain-containing protein [Candidatus Diapherotrites archaeon]|nr:nucleotidyltransferase domain-containing protein [Candidatus Diapherotrites archaeon]